MVVALGDVGDHASSAIFNAGIESTVVATTFIKKIERAKAKEAVKLLRLLGLMTRKVFAIRIAKKPITVFHNYLN